MVFVPLALEWSDRSFEIGRRLSPCGGFCESPGGKRGTPLVKGPVRPCKMHASLFGVNTKA